MNAPAPITGGINCPPVLAAASMAAAIRGRNPEPFIIGIVSAPVVATFATALPDSEPIKALATDAVLAGPPRLRLEMRPASPIKSFPPPLASRIAPNRTNRYTKFAETPSGIPQMPSVER